MRFTLYWGVDESARIYSIDELESLLGYLAAEGGRRRMPQAVDLLPAGAQPGGIQLGIGHAQRAFVGTLDPPGGFAVQPNVQPWPEPIAFACGRYVVELKPEWTRVTPCAAVRAAREFVRSECRSTGLRHDPNA